MKHLNRSTVSDYNSLEDFVEKYYRNTNGDCVPGSEIF